MWNILITINSVFVCVTSVFFIYSIGAGIILGEWKQLLLALLLLVFFCITEVILAALNM